MSVATLEGARGGQLGELLALWRHRMERRRSLARVSRRDLVDAGVSPSQAAFEAEQPFWRPLTALRGD